MHSETITQSDEPSQLIGLMPNKASTRFTGPMVGCSRYCQAVAMATSKETTGRK